MTGWHEPSCQEEDFYDRRFPAKAKALSGPLGVDNTQWEAEGP